MDVNRDFTTGQTTSNFTILNILILPEECLK